MKATEKARKSFEHQCRLASKCRHERYQASCGICPSFKKCAIQCAIEEARSKMNN